MDASTAMPCATCGALVSKEELTLGLAVRVAGRLVCPQCVDGLPGATQVKINQVRALRGLEVTTHRVLNTRHPHLNAFTFTTAANLNGHRRQFHDTGTFSAPVLAAGTPVPRLPKATPRGPSPKLVIGAGFAALVIIAVVVTLIASRPAAEAPDAPGMAQAAAPATPERQRLDYAAEPLAAWSEAAADRSCPQTVLQQIAGEVTAQRSAQLDAAERALSEDRLEATDTYLDSMSPPDHLLFQALRERAQGLRLRRTQVAAKLAADEREAAQPTSSAPERVATPAPAAAPPSPGPALAAPPTAEPPAPTGDRLLFKGSALALGKPEGWRIVPETSAIALAVERGAIDRSLDLAGGAYQLWVQARCATSTAVLTIRLGGRKLAAVTIPQGVKPAWHRLEPAAIELAAGPVNLRIDALGKNATVVAIYLAAVPFPGAPESEAAAFAAQPNWSVLPDPPVVCDWNPSFLNKGVIEIDRFDKAIPDGLPGNAGAVFASNDAGRKRQGLVFDIANAPVDDGGIVVLIHPKRSKRVLAASVAGADGIPVALPLLSSLPDQWSTVVIDLRGVTVRHPQTLTIEDAEPASTPFFFAKAVTAANTAPDSAMLALRPPALLPLTMRELETTLEKVAANRKAGNWAKWFDPALVKVMIGHQMQAGDWAKSTRDGLSLLLKEPLRGKAVPPGTISVIVLQDQWLNAMFAKPGGDGPIDPARHHLVCFCTAGVEFPIGLTEPQAVMNLWTELIPASIMHGVLPVVVLGPSKVNTDDLAEVEQMWRDVEAQIRKKWPGIPMIDLRPARARDFGHFAPGMSDLAAQLFLDGYGELYQRILALKVAGK